MTRNGCHGVLKHGWLGNPTWEMKVQSWKTIAIAHGFFGPVHDKNYDLFERNSLPMEVECFFNGIFKGCSKMFVVFYCFTHPCPIFSERSRWFQSYNTCGRRSDAAAADCSDWKGWKSAMEYAALIVIVQVWCAELSVLQFRCDIV